MKNYWDTPGAMYQEILKIFALVHQKILKVVFTFKYIKYGDADEMKRERNTLDIFLK